MGLCIYNILSVYYLAPSAERLQQVATRNPDSESTEGLNHCHQCALPLRTISVRVDALQEEVQKLPGFYSWMGGNGDSSYACNSPSVQLKMFEALKPILEHGISHNIKSVM